MSARYSCLLIVAPNYAKQRSRMAKKIGLGKKRQARKSTRSANGLTGQFALITYNFGSEGLCVALKTVEKFIERAIRLYEQEPGEACASARLGLYVQRWLRQAGAGVPRATSACITTAEAGGPSQPWPPTRAPRRLPLIAGSKLICLYFRNGPMALYRRRWTRGVRCNYFSQPFHKNRSRLSSTRRKLGGSRQSCRRPSCPSRKFAIRGGGRWGQC